MFSDTYSLKSALYTYSQLDIHIPNSHFDMHVALRRLW